MTISTVFKVGGVEYKMSFEETKEMETLHKSIVLANPRKYCNVCKNVDPQKFRLDSNKGKGYTFVNVVCTSCGAKSALGQYQDSGYFWKEFVKFERKSKSKSEEYSELL